MRRQKFFDEEPSITTGNSGRKSRRTTGGTQTVGKAPKRFLVATILVYSDGTVETVYPTGATAVAEGTVYGRFWRLNIAAEKLTYYTDEELARKEGEGIVESLTALLDEGKATPYVAEYFAVGPDGEPIVGPDGKWIKMSTPSAPTSTPPTAPTTPTT